MISFSADLESFTANKSVEGKQGCVNFSRTGRRLGKAYEARVPPFHAEFSSSGDMLWRKEDIHREHNNLQAATMQLVPDNAQTKNMKSPRLRRRTG